MNETCIHCHAQQSAAGTAAAAAVAAVAIAGTASSSTTSIGAARATAGAATRPSVTRAGCTRDAVARSAAVGVIRSICVGDVGAKYSILRLGSPRFRMRGRKHQQKSEHDERYTPDFPNNALHATTHLFKHRHTSHYRNNADDVQCSGVEYGANAFWEVWVLL